jgi:hypothetical protein
LEQKDGEFLGIWIPAIRFNLFIFKEKIKRIFTSIRAKERDKASLLLFFCFESLCEERSNLICFGRIS